MIDLTWPLDLDHPNAGTFLQGIQGNIIKGHWRVRWEAPYQRAIHAMILLADDDEHRLDVAVADVAPRSAACSRSSRSNAGRR